MAIKEGIMYYIVYDVPTADGVWKVHSVTIRKEEYDFVIELLKKLDYKIIQVIKNGD